MTQLLMHTTTRQQVENLLSHPPHALLISGPSGSGKETTAQYVASQLLGVSAVLSHRYVKHIYPIKQSIGIEAIREIRGFLGLKTTGHNLIRRIVIVYDAHLMTIEAQNSLLKSLEEPPEDTALILTTSDFNLLKVTIISRVQHIRIEPVSKTSAESELTPVGYSSQAVTSAYYMSDGRPALLIALLEQKTDHPLVAAITAAKQLLRLNLYERLLQVDTLSKDKQQFLLLLEGLKCVIGSGLQQSALKNDQVQLRRFHKLSLSTQQASEAVLNNANAKLVLSNLFLQV